MKSTQKVMKESFDELTKHAKKHSGGFALDGKKLLKGNPRAVQIDGGFALDGKKLLKDNPRAVQIDGVYVDADKETISTIFGKKIVK